MIEIFIDGSCLPVNPGGTASYGYLIKRRGEVLAYGSGIVGKGKGMTNNVAEYNALIHSLKKIRELELEKEKIIVKSDSNLVVHQMNGDWSIKTPLIVPLQRKAKEMIAALDISFKWISREENEEADQLSRKACTR